jgi:hypothetical protein
MVASRDWSKTEWTAKTWPHKRPGFYYKDLPNYEGCYLVCDGGWFVDMRPKPNGYELLGTDVRDRGYYVVPIRDAQGVRQNNMVRDRTILLVFKPDQRPAVDEVCKHLDGDPTNGHIDNLYWGQPRSREKHDVDALLKKRQAGATLKALAEEHHTGAAYVHKLLNTPDYNGAAKADALAELDPNNTVAKPTKADANTGTSTKVRTKWSQKQLGVIEAYRSQQRMSAGSFAPLPDLTDEQILGLAPN